MKKLLSLILMCALWLPSPALAVDFFSHDNGYERLTYHYYGEGRSVTDKPVTIHVDGIYLASDAMPFIENGRTLVPLRAAAESLGATVEWNGATNTALISKDTDVLLFTQDKLNYLINNRILPLDVPLKNKNSRLFIPLRALGEALGVDVSWDAEQNDVVITTGAEQGSIPVCPSTSPNNWQW